MEISGSKPVPKHVAGTVSHKEVSDKALFLPQAADLPASATAAAHLSKEEKADIRHTVWLYALLTPRTESP